MWYWVQFVLLYISYNFKPLRNSEFNSLFLSMFVFLSVHKSLLYYRVNIQLNKSIKNPESWNITEKILKLCRQIILFNKWILILKRLYSKCVCVSKHNNFHFLVSRRSYFSALVFFAGIMFWVALPKATCLMVEPNWRVLSVSTTFVTSGLTFTNTQHWRENRIIQLGRVKSNL